MYAYVHGLHAYTHARQYIRSYATVICVHTHVRYVKCVRTCIAQVRYVQPRKYCTIVMLTRVAARIPTCVDGCIRHTDTDSLDVNVDTR
jgi:hypothetical protein